jgi:predicted transcriptional regulator
MVMHGERRPIGVWGIPMRAPSGHDQSRYQARLDADTHATLEAWAATFHRTRVVVLRHVMAWGLTQTHHWAIDPAVPRTAHTLSLVLDPTLYRQVQEAAAAHGATVAAWVRHALRQMRVEDFPQDWQTDTDAGRSHDSERYRTRFMLRLDARTTQKLQSLVDHVGRPRAAIIRHLIARARPEDFPES